MALLTVSRHLTHRQLVHVAWIFGGTKLTPQQICSAEDMFDRVVKLAVAINVDDKRAAMSKGAIKIA
jgi:hypothetical protein